MPKPALQCPRKIRVNLYADDAEKAYLDARAAELNITVTSYLRFLIRADMTKKTGTAKGFVSNGNGRPKRGGN